MCVCKSDVGGWKQLIADVYLCVFLSLHRASISRDPFYDMLATRKRRIANKKWWLHRLHSHLHHHCFCDQQSPWVCVCVCVYVRVCVCYRGYEGLPVVISGLKDTAAEGWSCSDWTDSLSPPVKTICVSISKVFLSCGSDFSTGVKRRRRTSTIFTQLDINGHKNEDWIQQPWLESVD